MSTPVVRFIRTTHHHGRPRSFPAEARQFWRAQGNICLLQPDQFPIGDPL